MTSNPALSPVGAYVDRDDPSTVFVFACADAPGGKFSALRVGGIWKPASLTVGDVAEDFKPVTDRAEVDALLKAAEPFACLATLWDDLIRLQNRRTSTPRRKGRAGAAAKRRPALPSV